MNRLREPSVDDAATTHLVRDLLAELRILRVWKTRYEDAVFWTPASALETVDKLRNRAESAEREIAFLRAERDRLIASVTAKGYGMVTARTCATCGKPYPAWSVTSSMCCSDCTLASLTSVLKTLEQEIASMRPPLSNWNWVIVDHCPEGHCNAFTPHRKINTDPLLHQCLYCAETHAPSSSA